MGSSRIDLRDYVKDLANEVFASLGEERERIKLILEIEDVSLNESVIEVSRHACSRLPRDNSSMIWWIVPRMVSRCVLTSFPRSRSGTHACSELTCEAGFAILNCQFHE